MNDNNQKPQKNNNNNNNGNGGGNNRTPIYAFIVFALIALFVTSLIYTRTGSSSKEEMKYSKLVELVNQDQVESVEFDSDKINITLKEDATYQGSEEMQKTQSVYEEKTGQKLDVQYYAVYVKDDNFVPLLEQHGVEISAKAESSTASIILNVLSWILPIVLIWLLMSYAMKKMGGGGAFGVGKSNAKVYVEKSTGVTFKDVAGQDEAKESLEEVVDFLHNPKKYTEIGAKLPKGALLVGPPGTGKTLLAKAVAGEAGVPFFSLAGSDFVEMFVGVGASRVRDLFRAAREKAPCIIFIDELDAIGKSRVNNLGGNDEREQTLNQLLVEMDGFDNEKGLILLAATNRADILDNALLRPGRFDRQIYVGLPDIRGREEILKIHSRDKQLADTVDLNSIAKGTPGFAGADLENLMNEAAILAVRRKERFITQEDIDEAILKVQMGPEKKSRKMSDKARKLTAYHEAGHAIAGKYLQNVDPVHYITIIPRGQAGGFTLFRPQEDLENFKSRAEMYESIVLSLGGRIAEELFLDDISTGASGDIQQATQTARDMVTRYGMSEKLGPILFDSSDHSIFIGRDFGTTKSYSEETAAIIDEEVKALFDKAAAHCRQILTDHRQQLIDLAEYLLEHETISGEDFDYYFEHGEFMPEFMKVAKNAVNDKTIERPARKIAMFDEAAQPTPEASQPEAQDMQEQEKE